MQIWGGGGGQNYCQSRQEKEGVGAKKFGMSLEARETKLFWRDIPGFCRDIPEAPEKFEKTKFLFNLRSLEKCGGWVVEEALALRKMFSGSRLDPQPQRLPIFYLVLVGEVNP